MKRLISAGLVLAAAAGGGASWAQTLRFDREKVLAVDMKVERFSPRRSPAAGGPGAVWSVNLPPLPRAVSRIRLRLRALTAGDPATWEVRVRDLGVETLQTVSGAMIASTPDGFWTDELPAAQVNVELSWNGQGERPVLESDRYAYATGMATPQAIVGLDQRRSITTATSTYRALGRSVARLRIMTDEGQGYCTGFLLGEGLLMTNEHCVRTDAEAASLLVDFAFDSWSARAEVVRGARLLAVDAALDYALLQLPKSVEASFGRVHLETVQAVRDRQELLIIQHPGGEPKQISLEGCVVAGEQREGATAVKTDFGHECDTLGGSSGSPVFDRATGRVMGLHHFGFRQGVDEPVNQAVQISRILDDLSTRVDAPTFNRVTQQVTP